MEYDGERGGGDRRRSTCGQGQHDEALLVTGLFSGCHQDHRGIHSKRLRCVRRPVVCGEDVDAVTGAQQFGNTGVGQPHGYDPGILGTGGGRSEPGADDADVGEDLAAAGRCGQRAADDLRRGAHRPVGKRACRAVFDMDVGGGEQPARRQITGGDDYRDPIRPRIAPQCHDDRGREQGDGEETADQRRVGPSPANERADPVGKSRL